MVIRAKINVGKIDKEHLFKGKQNTYLDIALIETPNSEYGDYMIVQDLGKEARLAGKKGNILGNAKRIDEKKTFSQKVQVEERKPVDTMQDDIPF